MAMCGGLVVMTMVMAGEGRDGHHGGGDDREAATAFSWEGF
jgi:hypothetical protein